MPVVQASAAGAGDRAQPPINPRQIVESCLAAGQVPGRCPAEPSGSNDWEASEGRCRGGEYVLERMPRPQHRVCTLERANPVGEHVRRRQDARTRAGDDRPLRGRCQCHHRGEQKQLQEFHTVQLHERRGLDLRSRGSRALGCPSAGNIPLAVNRAIYGTKRTTCAKYNDSRACLIAGRFGARSV